MMKFAIQSRNDALSNRLMDEAKDYLTDFGLVFDEDEPDIVLSIGGDGTLLHAFHKYQHRCRIRHSSVSIRGILDFMPIGSPKSWRNLSFPLRVRNLTSLNTLCWK